MYAYLSISYGEEKEAIWDWLAALPTKLLTTLGL
jgi:hypothetical protein